MTQLVTRVSAELVAEIDALVDDGVVASRSDAVRRGLEQFIDCRRREQIRQQTIEAYQRQPQRDDESIWTDEDTERMIAEEPW